MNATYIRTLVITAALWLAGYVSAQTLVTKVAEDFESVPWIANPDNMAGGTISTDSSIAGALGDRSKKALHAKAVFSGSGFEFFAAIPSSPLVIPGTAKSVSFWVRGDGKQDWALSFLDGYGRSQVGGYLVCQIPAAEGSEWHQIKFKIPEKWVQPISIASITTHNFGKQAEKFTSEISVDQIEVETDLIDFDEATSGLKSWKPNPEAKKDAPNTQPPASLLSATVSGTSPHNVFSGEAPSFLIRVQNWKSPPMSGSFHWKVLDGAGSVIEEDTSSLNVDAITNRIISSKASKFGLYTLEAKLKWSDGRETSSSQPFAIIPKPRELSEQDKDASPYGLNVLAARAAMVDTFRKAGIIWYRDYAFNYEWMIRAKGPDKSYRGWPGYPKIMEMYDRNDIRLVACLQRAILRPATGEPDGQHLTPDLNWTREMTGVLLAFPSLRYFELDNEYDLNYRTGDNFEVRGNWAKYRAYHRKFGDLVKLLGDGKWTAIENGRAGIFPERLNQAVQSGDFANIDVVNSHHYTGTDPPETNLANFNTNFDGSETMLTFFDQLRSAKTAGSSDGKRRDHWLTEFGWDDVSGPAVSAFQQAAYLQRGYLLLMAAGTSKGFWFFDIDSPKKLQIFDSCGLVRDDQLPKLSLCAYAGLTQVLPRPKYVGTINAGPGTAGYVFRNDDQLIATLFSISETTGASVTFDSGNLVDYLGNPIDGRTVTLTQAPVYAVGIDPNSPLLAQTAYSLDTPYLVQASGGDTVTCQLQVKNDRSSPTQGSIKLGLPAGWTAEPVPPIAVKPGQTALVPLKFRVAPAEVTGEKTVSIAIAEDRPITTIPLRVRVDRPLQLAVRGMTSQPGKAAMTVLVTNLSQTVIEGELRATLPASWSTATPRIKVDPIEPRHTREIPLALNWSPQINSGESAFVEFVTTDGRSSRYPIIPSQYTIHKLASVKLDGDLSDWPARNQVPDWMIGSTVGDAKTRFSLGWSDDGLWVGVVVTDSKIAVPDPKSFWAGDGLELFVDTRNDKTPRKYATTDHQFWIVPQIDTGRIYAGRWKREDEITATQYDIPIKGESRKVGDGYVMEFMIPKSLMTQFKPGAGNKIGMNLNLSIQGHQSPRESFWFQPKAWGIPDQPHAWGVMELSE